MLIRLIVPGEHARVEDLNTSLDAVLTRHGIARAVRDDVRLVVEELACNAIEHGGAGDAENGQHELSVNIDIDGDLLKLEFRDQGRPFDPLSLPTPDLDAEIADREVGGLGVHLIREIAHAVHYQRTAEQNVLQVSLRIPHPEQHR